MKFTKILLVALSLMLFSCTPADVDVVIQTELELKSGGLTQKEVEELRSRCVAISTTPAFQDMNAKAKTFAEMMNHMDEKWTSRSDVEAWLDSNLSQTEFATKQEGLDMFDDLSHLTGVYYDANESFYRDLSPATPGQIKVILEPIKPVTPVIVVTTSCHSACENFFLEFIGNVIDHYNSQVQAINNNGSLPAEVKKNNLALAQANLQFGINAGVFFAQLCLDDCDSL
jgi:hypothetical protein